MPRDEIAFAGIFDKEAAAPLEKIGADQVFYVIEDGRGAGQVVGPAVGFVPHVDRADGDVGWHERFQFVQALLQLRGRCRIEYGQGLQISRFVKLLYVGRC